MRLAAVGEEEPGPWQEVVGVASNFGLTPTGDGEADYMYMPVAAADAGYVVVRVNGDARAFVPRLQTLAARIDPALRLHDVLTLREVIRRMDESMISATLIGVGIVVGNIVVGLMLAVMLEEVQPRTVLPPMVLASIVMLLVGVGACLVPGRRALRIQPTEALKEA